MLEPAPQPPLNLGAYENAERELSAILTAAKRGHEASMRALIRAAAAPALEEGLRRIAVAADEVAPTLDEMKVDFGHSRAAKELRFAVNAADAALSKAAGRAVIVTLTPKPEAERAP